VLEARCDRRHFLLPPSPLFEAWSMLTNLRPT
jgi:hypothetical protein